MGAVVEVEGGLVRVGVRKEVVRESRGCRGREDFEVFVEFFFY